MEGHVSVLYDFYVKKSKDYIGKDVILPQNSDKKIILIT
jgi:hypothetical protein